MLSTNYRGDINVTDKLFPEAEKHMTEFYKSFVAAKEAGVELAGENEAIDEAFDRAMDDDFNTALALSDLFGFFKSIRAKLRAGDKSVGADLNQVKKTYSLLGLFKEVPEEFVKRAEEKEKSAESVVPKEIIALAEERLLARKNKDYARSDELRNEISAAGYEVKDVKDGYELIKK